MPLFVIDLLEKLPTTFENLILPVLSVPITFNGETICTTAVGQAGRVECIVPADVHDRLNRGDAIVRPVTDTVPVDGSFRLALRELEIVAVM